MSSSLNEQRRRMSSIISSTDLNNTEELDVVVVDRSRMPIRRPRTTPDKKREEGREKRRKPDVFVNGKSFRSEDWHIIDSPDDERPSRSRLAYERPKSSRLDYQGPDRAKPDEERPGRVRFDYQGADRTKPDEERPGRVRFDYQRPDRAKPDEERPRRSRFDYARPDEEEADDERPRAETVDNYDDVLRELDPGPEEKQDPVVQLSGTSIRDEDWDAIRKLADERPPHKAEDVFVGPWDPRRRMPDVLDPAFPVPPRPASPRPIRRYVPPPRAYYFRPGIGFVPLIIAGLAAALAICAYLGSLLGRAIYPR